MRFLAVAFVLINFNNSENILSYFQVSFYEQDPVMRNMNPALTVKQYSRSSADQEASLPHELRPTPVLQLTMQYLMCKIMDIGENPEVKFTYSNDENMKLYVLEFCDHKFKCKLITSTFSKLL